MVEEQLCFILFTWPCCLFILWTMGMPGHHLGAIFRSEENYVVSPSPNGGTSHHGLYLKLKSNLSLWRKNSPIMFLVGGLSWGHFQIDRENQNWPLKYPVNMLKKTAVPWLFKWKPCSLKTIQRRVLPSCQNGRPYHASDLYSQGLQKGLATGVERIDMGTGHPIDVSRILKDRNDRRIESLPYQEVAMVVQAACFDHFLTKPFILIRLLK